MIYTVTLNPAVDRTIIQPDFALNEMNRISKVVDHAGGKGINVSKMIRNLNGESIALGIISGLSGEFIRRELDELGIKNNFTVGEGKTRTNLKIVDMVNETYTDLNEPGSTVSEKVLKEVEKSIFDVIERDDIIIFAGSLPKGIDVIVYADWISKAKDKGCKVFFDADDEALELGVNSAPYLIKPNINELERLFGTEIHTTEEAVNCSKKLLDKGVEVVVVSKGEEGCLLVSRDLILETSGLAVDVKSTVGAGDSMVAGLAYAIENNYSLEDALRLGVACSTASIIEEGTTMGKIENIRKFLDIIEIRQRN